MVHFIVIWNRKSFTSSHYLKLAPDQITVCNMTEVTCLSPSSAGPFSSVEHFTVFQLIVWFLLVIHHIYKYRLINYRPNIETFMLTAIYLWNSRSAFIDLSSAAPAHLDAAGGILLLLKLVCYPPIYAEDVGEDEQVQHCDVTLRASNCCSEVERWLKTTKPNMSLPLCLDIWSILTPRCRNYKMGS